jgi:peptidoglycan hydrolase-like protein with peptidoglycan-binding domain
VALVSAAGLSLAILYNALLAQDVPGHASGLAAGDTGAGSTRLDVTVGATRTTVQLKYDPLAENVQRELQAIGIYKGDIDGVVGRRTRDAILAYQKSNGLEVTGEPSQDLVEHIRYTRQVAEASLFTGSVEPAPDAEERARVRRVQAALAELSIFDDAISGEYDPTTEAAIRRFERLRGLPETGQISDTLVRELDKVGDSAGNP